MSSYDYYGEAKRLAVELESAGFSSFATAILNTMLEGGTGTEILMMMRLELSCMIDVGNLPVGLKERAIVLHEKIDDALS
ncbi:MAG: hypothetical protein J0L85_12690 [Zoogloea sp.]|nr:hypothetical protein [Zoogloea sp.]MCA0184774.1 hypothetical protein [Pseudomonadota bacterium]